MTEYCRSPALPEEENGSSASLYHSHDIQTDAYRARGTCCKRLASPESNVNRNEQTRKTEEETASS